MNPRIVDPVWAGLFAAGCSVGVSPAWLVVSSGGLFGWGGLFEGDRVAERFELALEAAGAVLDGVALALPVGSEISVGDVVTDDVEVRDQEVVADRADRFLLSAAAAELGEVRGEIGVFRAHRSAGAFGELRGQPRRPGTGASRSSATG